MQIPRRRPTRFCSDPWLLFGTVSPQRENRYALFACGGRGELRRLRWKYLAPQTAMNSGAVSGFDCTPNLNTIYSKHDDTHITSFCLVSGPDTLFKNQSCSIVNFQFCVGFGGRWKLKILIRQGRSVNWRPSHCLSKQKSCSQGSGSLFGYTAEHFAISIWD